MLTTRRALTLVELVVALALTSVLLIAGAGLLVGLATGAGDAASRSQLETSLENARSQLTRDAADARRCAPGGLGTPVLDTGEDTLTLATRDAADVTAVRYEVTGGALERRSQTLEDTATCPDADDGLDWSDANRVVLIDAVDPAAPGEPILQLLDAGGKAIDDSVDCRADPADCGASYLQVTGAAPLPDGTSVRLDRTWRLPAAGPLGTTP